MALAVDTSRSITGPKARLALVQAIRNAGPHEPETHWIEWKSDARISEKSWRGELASHILGFANRNPDSAALATAGQAYLVVGVAPGELRGVESFDPAELEDWLTPYVGGANGPTWNPDYVDVRGVTVLLISIESPKKGDPIWTLRKAFTDPSGTTHHAGRIFLRRNGQTASQPTPAEIEMLQRRHSTQEQELAVALEIEKGDPVSALDLTDSAKTRWLKWQREEMLSSLEDYEEKPVAGGSLSFVSALAGDKRSADEYRQEVDACLDRANDAFAGMVRTRAVTKGVGLQKVSVVNQTQDNLQGLLVELKVEGPVQAFFSAREAAAAVPHPKRPRPYGEEQWMAGPVLPSVDGSLRHLLETNPGHISNENSAWIKFPEIDLRPGYRQGLAEFYLLADSSMCGSRLAGQWIATSKNVSGSIGDTLAIPVAETPVQVEDLRDPLDS